MKLVEKTGMALFVSASLFLIILLFVSNYRLTQDIIEDVFENDKQKLQLVREEFKDFVDNLYHSKFNFIDNLSDQLDHINDQLQNEYQISEKDIDKLINNIEMEDGKIVYKSSVIEQSFPGNNELSRFKIKQLSDYTSWMENKEFASKEALRNQLLDIRNNINQSIIDQVGFSESRIKDIKLNLTKSSTMGVVPENNVLLLFLTIGLAIIGGFMNILSKLRSLPGIKHNGIFHSKNKNKGWIGISIGVLLILFYVILYWYPEYMTEWIILADPLSIWIKNQPASHWFFYGLLYTLAILVMGVRMFIKYRHSKYHLVRTSSVMFFQTAFAFMIPEILMRLNKPSMDLKNIWPLNYDFFFGYNINQLITSGTLGNFMLVWGIILIILAVPLFSFFYGKRWYCSWVCGCGGLAETLGDPYRQLSDKSLQAWKVERWMVHSVLVLVTIMTITVLYTYFSGNSNIFGINSYSLRATYGFIIGAAFAGVVGVGFYPFMGNRVWCRFGCPLAAYIGLIQRFKSRFRITTNGGQCISCGNCSTYCEMGIDVRWYAQRGQNIIRASCVGCGVCSSVCPRGVLKLENRKEAGRFGEPILIGNDSVKVVN